MTTGLDLKLERIALRVTGQELSEQMGIHPSSLSRVENSARVTTRMAARYRTALATFGTVATRNGAA